MIFYLCDLSYLKNISPIFEEEIERIEDLIKDYQLVLTPQVIEQFFFKEDIEKLEEMIHALSLRHLKVYGLEMGCGLIPLDAKQRAIVECNGLVNQVFAKYAQEVYLKEAGINIRIK